MFDTLSNWASPFQDKLRGRLFAKARMMMIRMTMRIIIDIRIIIVMMMIIVMTLNDAKRVTFTRDVMMMISMRMMSIEVILSWSNTWAPWQKPMGQRYGRVPFSFGVVISVVSPPSPAFDIVKLHQAISWLLKLVILSNVQQIGSHHN